MNYNVYAKKANLRGFIQESSKNLLVKGASFLCSEYSSGSILAESDRIRLQSGHSALPSAGCGFKPSFEPLCSSALNRRSGGGVF